MMKVLRGLSSALAFAALTASAALADVTTKATITTNAGGPIASVSYVKGSKMRAETAMPGGSFSTFIDLAARRGLIVDHATHRVVTLAPDGSITARSAAAGEPAFSLRPNGDTKDILGRQCAGYTIALSVPISEDGRHYDAEMKGVMWVAKDGAGIEELWAFERAALEAGFAVAAPRSPVAATSVAQAAKAIDEIGVAFSAQWQLTAESFGEGLLPRRLGPLTITMTITGISTDSIPDDTFVVSGDDHDKVASDTSRPPRTVPLNDWRTAKAGMHAEIDRNVLRLSNGQGWVRTRNAYLDFVFRCRYRVMTDEAEGALLFRASREVGDGWPTAGYRLSVGGAKSDRPQAKLAGISQKTKMLTAAAGRASPGSAPGRWRDVEVTCRGSRVTVRIDGRPIADIEGGEPELGVIGIEARKGTIEYQDLTIGPLGSESKGPPLAWLSAWATRCLPCRCRSASSRP